MSKRSDPGAEGLVAIARAVKTRGLKGEIVADILTDFPERFEHVERLFAVSPSGERTTVELEDHWFQNERIVLKLRDHDTVESAEALRGYEFAVPEAERMPLEDDEYYDWELERCTVQSLSGEHLGSVSRVIRTGGVDLLAVSRIDGTEALIPMVESILVKIDKQEKSIVIDPPEGLLDL